MSTYKEQKTGYLFARLLAAPAFIKIVNVFHTVYLRLIGSEGSNMQRAMVKVVVNQPKISRHNAIIGLLNEGKNYNAAEMIADVSADWDLDLAYLDASTIDVKGKSVWINLED